MEYFYPTSPAATEAENEFLRAVGDRTGFHTTGNANAYVSTIVGGLCAELGVTLADLMKLKNGR